ncbi:D-2-hydroxyacid dehydrogenase [Plantibacter flavus]|uniref:D-2-hydroxyacid dehydrogenase n=1 Tax=Plantibacter flavus TaxID=150123 RepID=UPI003F1574B4
MATSPRAGRRRLRLRLAGPGRAPPPRSRPPLDPGDERGHRRLRATDRLERRGIEITTASGVHAIPLAEFALAGALHFVKDVPKLRRDQQARHWQRAATGQLAGRRVTVVGVGAMGRNVIRVFDAMGCHVTAVGRAGRDYGLADGVAVSSTDRLALVLPHTDVLVLCCALTPETEGLIDRAALAALPDGAILVNIARGAVVDEDALVQELASGRLAGAALDVVTEEPLAVDSPLWTLDNVLISPHSASTVETENATLTALFVDNLRRWRTGEPLLNRYDPDRGY